MVAATFQNAASQNVTKSLPMSLCTLAHAPSSKPSHFGQAHVRGRLTQGSGCIVFVPYIWLLSKCKDFKIRNLERIVRIIISTLLIKKKNDVERKITDQGQKSNSVWRQMKY